MKIKGIIKKLKFKKLKKTLNNESSKIYLGISLELLRAVGVSSVSDSFLFQLILLLKVYRSLPI